MLVYGGVREDGGTLSDLWLFSLPGKAWTLLRPSARAASELPLVARAWHTAVPSSTFATDALVFGGLDGTATSSVQEVSATPFLQGEKPFTTGLLRLAPPTCERADDAPAVAAPAAPTGEAEAGDVVNGKAALPAARAVVCVSCPAGTFTAFASPPPPPRPPPTPPQPRQPPCSWQPSPLPPPPPSPPISSPPPPPLPSPPPPPHPPPSPPPPPPSPPPPSPIATAANGTHGLRSRRLLHERDVFGGGPTSDDFGGRCQACPAGYLSVSPGSASCEPCPRGTASAARGLAGWDGCALCPQGTSSSVLGASRCKPCEVPYWLGLGLGG